MVVNSLLIVDSLILNMLLSPFLYKELPRMVLLQPVNEKIK